MTQSSRLIPVAALAADGDFFWATTAPGKLMKLAEGQEHPEVLAEVERATALAVDAAYVYFAVNHAVCRIARTGGELRVLANSLDAPDLVVVIEDLVYWVTCRGAIYMVDKDGGEPVRACAERGGRPL